MVVVKVTGGEGSDALVIERVGRSGSLLNDVAFVKLHFALAGHIFLGGFYERLQSLPQRAEPFCGVDHVGEFVVHVLFVFQGFLIQDQLFQLLVGFHKDRSAGGLINAAGLHAHHPVFYDVGDADAVLSAQFI